MPIEVTAYECEHGCGRRPMRTKAAMKKHEAECFSNPATRSCQTCDHTRDHKYDPATKQHMNFCACGGDWEPSTINCEGWDLRDDGVPA